MSKLCNRYFSYFQERERKVEKMHLMLKKHRPKSKVNLQVIFSQKFITFHSITETFEIHKVILSVFSTWELLFQVQTFPIVIDDLSIETVHVWRHLVLVHP